MPSRPPVFRPAHLGTVEQGSRAYERERGSARERGYDTRWDKSARLFKAEHPLCLGCEAVGRVSVTTVVDHIVPHRGDQALFWDPLNRQPACDPHHNVVKQILEARYLRGRATKADLRLDSAMAIALTHELMG